MTRDAKRAVREFRAPDERGAERRAWAVIHDAYMDREPARARARTRGKLAVVPVLAVVAAGLVLSPAGATVGRLITKAFGVRHAAPMLSSLPSAGRVLLSGPGGTWTAAADGSLRHLGDWTQASWSPRGLYVAVVSPGRLAAVDPRGDVKWAIARPGISDPSWFFPSGYRVAYLSVGTLRVLAGDGSSDHLVAARVAHVAPAWRPGYSFQLAYVTAGNRLVVRDADTEQVIWSRALGAPPRELLWSSDGSRLVVVSAHSVRTYPGSGGRPTVLHVPSAPIGDAALSPDGRRVALVLGGDRVVIVRAGAASSPVRPLLAVAGLRELSWSPNGRWLLASLPAADQWVFVRALGPPRVAAVGHISQQFSSRGSAARSFPQLEGWCCTVQGPAG